MLVEISARECSNSTSNWLKLYKLQHKIEYNLSLMIILTSIKSIPKLKLQSFNTTERLIVSTRLLVNCNPEKNQAGVKPGNQAVIFRFR